MDNADMKRGRFLVLYQSRQMLGAIKAKIDDNGVAYLCTYGHATKVQAKHLPMFRATKSGLFMQSGRKWVCVNGSAVC